MGDIREEAIKNWPVCGHKCKGKHGCCNPGSCRANKGYYHPTERFKIGWDKLVKYWDNITGFWSKTGCRLPLELRSIECLTYKCNGKFK